MTKEEELQNKMVRSAEEAAQNIRRYLEIHRDNGQKYVMLLHGEIEEIADKVERLANTFKAYSYRETQSESQ